MKKKTDAKGRYRDKTVAFRMSQVENNELNIRIAFSGMSKQDYLISRVLEKEIIVRPNVRILKVLEKEIKELNTVLKVNTGALEEEQLFILQQVIDTIDRLSKG